MTNGNKHEPVSLLRKWNGYACPDLIFQNHVGKRNCHVCTVPPCPATSCSYNLLLIMPVTLSITFASFSLVRDSHS